MAYHYKQDFPIFQHTDVAYIDNAATAQRPQCVLDAVADFYRCHNSYIVNMAKVCELSGKKFLCAER